MKNTNTYLNRYQNLIFGLAAKRFEEKLLLGTTLLVSLILIAGTIIDIVIGLNDTIVVVAFVGSLFFLGLYFYGRLRGLNRSVTAIICAFTLFYLNLIWYVNYGSNGPMMLTFVIYYSFVILVFDKKYLPVVSAILFLDILGLYLIELKYPEIIGTYSDPIAKLNDNYSGMIFSLGVIFSFTAAIKQNYIQEYNRAKMSDQLKSAFLANMSHEIRTPLNAIVGFSSLMSDPDIGDEDKKLFGNQVLHNSDYLLNLIDDIIDVSKIESNQLDLKIQDVDVVPVISQIIQSFQLSVLSGKNVTVKCSLDMPKIVIRVDKIRFEQILRNLLSNAVKFTENGVVEVSCKRVNGFYAFSVKDTGIGIHSDHHKEIFDRFIKIDNNKQHLYRGTGIGLFLSKQLVEMFGGNIWLESEVGKGSTFYFKIPV